MTERLIIQPVYRKQREWFQGLVIMLSEKKKKRNKINHALDPDTLRSGILTGRTPEADIMALFDQCFHQVFSWPINRVTIVHKHLKEKWNLGTHFK